MIQLISSVICSSSVGKFEADALRVPTKCHFKHLHFNSNCRSEVEWKQKAAENCFSDNMHLKDLGMLLPCDIDMFSGVEFVCCPIDSKGQQTVNVTAEPTAEPATTPKPLSILDKLKQRVSKFANLVSSEIVGMYSSGS